MWYEHIKSRQHQYSQRPSQHLHTTIWIVGTSSNSDGKYGIDICDIRPTKNIQNPTFDFLLSWFWAASRLCMLEIKYSKIKQTNKQIKTTTTTNSTWTTRERDTESKMYSQEINSNSKVPYKHSFPHSPKLLIIYLTFSSLSPYSSYWRGEKQTLTALGHYVVICSCSLVCKKS